MASQVNIWNLALSNIGHKASVTDPDEASAEAHACRQFYSIALKVALERYAWSFATRRIALSEVDNPIDHWQFAYALPNNCVAVRAVLPPETTDDLDEQTYAIESDEDGNGVLYTNMEDAVARYTTLAEDTTKYTPLFVLTLAADLASMLVGLIPKDPKKRQEMQQLAIYYTGLAQANDAKNSHKSNQYRDFIPSHLGAR